MKHAAQCGRCGPLLKNAAETIADEATASEEALLASLRSARPEWRKNMAEKLRGSAGAMEGGGRKEEGATWWPTLFSWPRPAFALAGIAAAVTVGWLGVLMLRPPSAEQLLAQAYTEHRTLEVRIPGAKYAPMRVERAAGGSSLDKSPSLLKAEALIGENLRKSPNDPAWLQAKARADLLDGNYESAIKSLQRALETQPDDPPLLTDLGSAYFVRAEAANHAIDYGNAIESQSKALAKSPDDPIALFNRALACERMFLYTQAVDDWEHYLRVDPQGQWAEDARRRLTALKENLHQHEKSQAEPLLSPAEIAEADTDNAAVRAEIDERIEEYLHVAVTEWLPRAYPVRMQNGTDVDDFRAALRAVADITSQKHGDRWLGDVSAAESSHNFATAAVELSDALKANDTGDNVSARQHASAAERLFGAAGDDAGALRARVEYIFASHDAQEGNECLQIAQGLDQLLANRPYAWLKTQFHIEQGTCFWLVGNLGGARESYERAERDAQVSGYQVIFLRTQDHSSALYTETGDFNAGATKTQLALAHFWSGHYPAMRGYNLYFNAYEASRLTNRPHLEVAVWRDGLALSESFNDNVLRAMAHSAMADAAVAAGSPTVAEEEFAKTGELFAASPQIKSTQIARIEAETRLASVEVSQGRAQEALVRLRRFAPEVSSLSEAFLQVLFYTTMGDAESRIGDDKQAESYLHSAVALAELQLRSLNGDKARIGWETRTSNAYRDFVQLRLRQGDAANALEIWELYRGAAPRAGNVKYPAFLTKTESQKPNEVATVLPSLTNETIVSYALLPQGLAVWVYDNRGVFVHLTDEEHSDIEAKVERFRSLCSDPNSDFVVLQKNARALYDLLVAPIEERLSSGRILVIELDDRLAGLPFDALIDQQGRYLSERAPIVHSLGIYYRRTVGAFAPITKDSLALVAAVSSSSVKGNASFSPLPDADSEGELVAHEFLSTQLLLEEDATAARVVSRLPNATVFHFAGHAINSQQQQSGLLLSDALLTGPSLRKVDLSRMRLAVFSACDTQGGSTGAAYDSDSLVRVFLRAGVPDVVASRWNVDSAATWRFMDLFYRALLKGSTPAEAIHQAQSGLRSLPGMGHPYYWSAFSSFGLV
jgi:CHAT domain-containing protein/cytochrome c-type biogenesis protein CcmH/NrfG